MFDAGRPDARKDKWTNVKTGKRRINWVVHSKNPLFPIIQWQSIFIGAVPFYCPLKGNCGKIDFIDRGSSLSNGRMHAPTHGRTNEYFLRSRMSKREDLDALRHPLTRTFLYFTVVISLAACGRVACAVSVNGRTRG